MTSRRKRRTNKKSTKKKREQFGSPLQCTPFFFSERPFSRSGGIRRSLLKGILGKDHLNEKLKKSKIEQISDNIKEAESLINDICQENPDPIKVEENSKKIKKLMLQAHRLSAPLAKKAKRQNRIKEKIDELKDSDEYVFSIKDKKFIRKIKNKPKKKNKTKTRKRKVRSKRK